MSRLFRRLILRCGLCSPEGVLIEPTSSHPLYAAADHALDEHLDQLIADPDGVFSALRVAA